MRVIHAQALAQRVQRIALAGKTLPRHFQRILHAAALADRAITGQTRQFGIKESNVERGVVDDQFGAIDEGQEFVRDFGETRFIGEKFQGEAGDFLRAGFEFAIWMQILLIGPPGRAAFDHLDAADFDDAVALFPFQAGGFGIEDYFSHTTLVLMPCVRVL